MVRLSGGAMPSRRQATLLIALASTWSCGERGRLQLSDVQHPDQRYLVRPIPATQVISMDGEQAASQGDALRRMADRVAHARPVGSIGTMDQPAHQVFGEIKGLHLTEDAVYVL